MKVKKYCLIFAVMMAILCTPALSEIKQLSDHDDATLLARANPTLAGIGKLRVVIVPVGAEPNKGGLAWTELEVKVAHKLNEAGIKIAPGIAGQFLNIPELRVDIDMLEFVDSQRYVFRIQTSLSRAVRLARKSNFSFKADAWKTEPTMQVVAVKDMPGKVTDVILEQVEAFIHAHAAANPKGVQPADVNNVSVVPKEQAKPIVKPAEAEQKYVASKNSKVFHKSGCSWALRITQENLVSYDGRNAAVNAGKRPCKRCKP